MISLTFKSQNRKLNGDTKHPAYTGRPIASTSRRVGANNSGTCPSTCSLLSKDAGGTKEGGGGCYAQSGPVAFVQRRSGYDATDGERLKTFLADLPRSFAVRHHVTGDVGLENKVDHEYIKAMVDGHAENPQVVGFGYTHFWSELSPSAFDGSGNLTMNASAENHEQVKDALAMGWPVVSVVPSTENRKSWREDGVRYVACPEVTTGLGCRDCLLCARGDRDFVIAFPAHGSSKKKVDRMFDTLTALPMASD